MEPTDQEIYRLLYRLGITANYAGFFHLRHKVRERRTIRESRRAARKARENCVSYRFVKKGIM